ncbi:MAG: hypothetical protein FWF10_08870 [Clostridiales bacterium]|nr:hypothetical protein [Clostridiales bacterium]
MNQKKLLAIVIAVILCLSVPMSALADENAAIGNDPYYTDQYTVDSEIIHSATRATLLKTPTLKISSPSTGKITINATVQTFMVVEKVGLTTITLQRWNGSAWVVTNTWTNQFAYNTNTFSWTKSDISAISGASYRVSATFYAQNGTDTHSITVTTSSITCK